MSGQNSEANGMAFVLALFGAGMLLLGMFIFAVAVVFAVVLTIIAFLAWNKPLTVFGETVQPHEARWFVYRGIIGMYGLPAFAVFCHFLFGFHIGDSVLSWLFLGGYVGGSVGIEALKAMNEAEAANAPTVIEQTLPSAKPSTPIRELPASHPEPFRYASWDDEEARK